jgi:hypothetical protein
VDGCITDLRKKIELICIVSYDNKELYLMDLDNCVRKIRKK